MEEGWWLTWDATTLQTNWVPPNWRSGITPERGGEEKVLARSGTLIWNAVLQISDDACAHQGHLNGPFSQNPHKDKRFLRLKLLQEANPEHSQRNVSKYAGKKS